MTDAKMIPFPRLGYTHPECAARVADVAQTVAHVGWYRNPPNRCANGMPGHPPCRSVEELNELLRRREAAGEIA